MPKQPTVGLRQHLANLLRMKGAHLTFQDAVADLPALVQLFDLEPRVTDEPVEQMHPGVTQGDRPVEVQENRGRAQIEVIHT